MNIEGLEDKEFNKEVKLTKEEWRLIEMEEQEYKNTQYKVQPTPSILGLQLPSFKKYKSDQPSNNLPFHNPDQPPNNLPSDRVGVVLNVRKKQEEEKIMEIRNSPPKIDEMSDTPGLMVLSKKKKSWF